jgi:hypothetical protein
MLSSQTTRTDLASFTPIAAVLALLVGVFPLWKITNLSAVTPSERETTTTNLEGALPGYSGARSVYAGLWGDPFNGISEGKGASSSASDLPAKPSVNATQAADYRCLLSKFEKLTLLPVIVRGGDTYSERYDRINYRHAVELALAENDFSMEFPDRMSFVSVEWKVRKDGDVFPWFSEVPIKLYTRPALSVDNPVSRSMDASPNGEQALLVCWIDNRLLGDKPLTTLSEVLSQIASQQESNVSLIGPIYSGELECVVAELGRAVDVNKVRPSFSDWKIYSPTATNYDSDRLEEIEKLIPLMGTDRQVVDALVDEIELRRLNLGQIVIFSEASAVSPKSLSSQLISELGTERPPIEYRYLKGFGDEKVKSSEAVDDYFLRILEKAAKNEGVLANPREVSAVVILGDEIEDKLALIKVAKSVFPNATCLTHDLYARYFENLVYCKGLIVASHGGLSDQLQGRTGEATVEFRDCYQRSVYDATTLAVNSEQIKPTTNDVSLFEISNNGPVLIGSRTVAGQVWKTSLFCFFLVVVFGVFSVLYTLRRDLAYRIQSIESTFLNERLELYTQAITGGQNTVTSKLWSNIHYRLWIDAQHYCLGGLVSLRLEVILSVFVVYAVIIGDMFLRSNPAVFVGISVLLFCCIFPILREVISRLLQLRKLNKEWQEDVNSPEDLRGISQWLKANLEERRKKICELQMHPDKMRWHLLFMIPVIVFLVDGICFRDRGRTEFLGINGVSVWPCIVLFLITIYATHWWLKKYGSGGLPWIPKLGGLDSLLPFRNRNEVGNIPCISINELRWTLNARTHGARAVSKWIPISALLSITAISRGLSMLLLFLVFVWQLDIIGFFPWALLPLPPARGILAIVIAIFAGTLSLFLCLRVSFTALSHVYFFWRFTRFIRGKWKTVLEGRVSQTEVAKEWGSKEAWQKEKIEDLYWVCDFTQSGSGWLLKHALWYPSLILLLFAFSRLPILETWQVNSETIILVAGFPIMAGLISAIFLRGECKRLREMACGILSDWSVNPEVAYEAPYQRTEGNPESAGETTSESAESPERVVVLQHPSLDDLRKLADSIRGRIERMTGGAFVSLWNDPVVGSLLAIVTAMASGPGKGIVDSLLKFAFN